MTVCEVLAHWCVHAKVAYDQRSQEPAQFKFALRPLDRLWGDMPAEDFDADALRAVQMAMATGSWMTEEEIEALRKRGRNVGLCRCTLNHRLSRIKTVWRWAESRKLVPKGSYAALLSLRGLGKKNPSVRHTVRKPAACVADVLAILPHVLPPVAAAIQVQLYTGARAGEAIIMRPCDVDRESLKVDGQPIWVYRPEWSKNDWRENATARAIPIGPKLQEVLKPFLDTTAAAAYLFNPRVAYEQWLTANNRRKKHAKKRFPGERYTVNSYNRAIAKGCRRAGVQRWTSHQIRYHVAASIGPLAGLEGVRQVLGQHSVDIAAHYAGLDLEAAARIVANIG